MAAGRVAPMPEADLYEQLIAAADGIYGGVPARPSRPAREGRLVRGHVHRDPGGRRPSRARFISAGEPVARPGPLLQRTRRPRGRRRRARGARVRGQAARLRRRGDRHPGDHDARLPHQDRGGLPRAARAAPPDPETGQPDFEKLGAFLAAHPEAQTAIQGRIGVGPLASFATARLLLAAHLLARRCRRRADGGALALAARGRRAAARRRRGEGPRSRLPTTRTCASGLARGTTAFGSSSAPARSDDPLDDPTALWPDDRELVDRRPARDQRRVDDPERDDHIDVFDPLRLTDGVEPSDDPILHARRRAYSVSAYRRWGRPPGPPPGD